MMFDSTVWVIYNCLQSANVIHRLRGVVYIKRKCGVSFRLSGRRLWKDPAMINSKCPTLG